MSKQHQFDVLIIGSGAAGLMSAIQLHFNQDYPKQLDKTHNSVIIKL